MSQSIKNGIVVGVALAAVVAAVWGVIGNGFGGKTESKGEQGTAASPDDTLGQTETSKQKRQEADDLPPALPQEGPLRGQDMPEITLVDREGEPVSLRDNDGKSAIINVWASWCPPCKDEMPHLQTAYEKHGDQVQFHMVNLTNRDSLDKMDAFLREEAFTFPVLLDEEGATEKELQILGIPNTFVLDGEGRIIHHIAGYMDEKTVEKIMEELTS
ncbi:TlpA family protein disulfide reductase [Desmospora activa]|uniref:Peroxiredoxin n=1 Tax=Desmospora activa DSM 45169 TaxID=1121389 RepID=A0A2T4ZBH6_9BACL|nr:TlpA disulfide reductase family protein [Desmospora activa]PTM59249.1 peroxiredoxin [Desmospora activa DSM 45169]